MCLTRDLPAAALSELLSSWERLTDDVSEICDKVKELQVMMNSEDSKSSRSAFLNVYLRSSSHRTDVPKDPKVLNDGAVALIEWMVRDQMKPIESLLFHEVLCYKRVDKLQTLGVVVSR
ncbi:Origin of replication complex subunit 3 [Bienertia sinuspersici]